MLEKLKNDSEDLITLIEIGLEENDESLVEEIQVKGMKSLSFKPF